MRLADTQTAMDTPDTQAAPDTPAPMKDPEMNSAANAGAGSVAVLGPARS